MAFQAPIILLTSSGNGYAVQFNGPHPSAYVIQKTGPGEHYLKPVLQKPTTPLATTSASVVTAGLAQSMTLASATGVAIGSTLYVSDGANSEYIIVSNLVGAVVTADFANAHNGSGTAFAVQGFQFPAAPTGSPAVSAGQPRQGWYHMTTIGEKYTKGLEPQPTGGGVLVPGAPYDQVYGFLIWAVTGSELDIDAH